MKKYLFFVFSFFLLCSCSSEDGPLPNKRTGRTLLAYFMADNSLKSELTNNIVMMYKGMQELKDTCTFFVYWDSGTLSSTFPDPCILKYECDGRGNINGQPFLTKAADILNAADIVKIYPSPKESATKESVIGVIRDMISYSNAKDYGLILGSHGSGWLKHINGSNSRSIGQDGSNTDNTITIPDLNEALLSTGIKFKYILFDACMMGNIETLYELRNTCNYSISSPMEVPADGYPYQKLMKYLFSDNVNDYTENVCKTITDFFDENRDWGNYLAVKSDELESFAQLTNKLLLENRSNIDSVDSYKVQMYTNGYSGTFKGMSYDMKDYFLNLTNNNIPNAYIDQLKKTIVASTFVPGTDFYDISFNDISVLCGLGMYVPTSSSKVFWKEYYQTLSWANVSGWNDILKGI